MNKLVPKITLFNLIILFNISIMLGSLSKALMRRFSMATVAPNAKVLIS